MELINKTNTLGSLRKNMTALELARNYIRHNDSQISKLDRLAIFNATPNTYKEAEFSMTLKQAAETLKRARTAPIPK